jgi:hypothetical protein
MTADELAMLRHFWRAGRPLIYDVASAMPTVVTLLNAGLIEQVVFNDSTGMYEPGEGKACRVTKKGRQALADADPL